MATPFIKTMAAINPKMVNEALVTLAAAVLAGNKGETPTHAVKTATEALEEIFMLGTDDGDGG